MFAVVTGGGTSGHVMPALAIIELLKENGYTGDQLAYVGAQRGIETRLMSDVDVCTEFLPISGLQRSLSMRSFVQNALLPYRLLRSRRRARALLRAWQPSVVVSVGGYASEPIAAEAISLQIPLVCVSYDRIAGLATRRQARHATVSAVAFPDSTLPHAVQTGAPVRSVLRHLSVDSSRGDARERLGLPRDGVVVTVLGGSLGSGVLNSAVPGILKACAAVGTVSMFHICGERFFSELPPCDVPMGVTSYRRVGYESHMHDVYAATDLLVARAGASTVAEIATVGVAAILVPWKDAADNHQQLNAEWLAHQQAAVVLSEEKCAAGALAHEVALLAGDAVERARLAQAARDAGAIHRGSTLLNVILNAAR